VSFVPLVMSDTDIENSQQLDNNQNL
jgi:hypothetical protein